MAELPEFDQLDETLQDSFAAFLAERGVDESLCEHCLPAETAT